MGFSIYALASRVPLLVRLARSNTKLDDETKKKIYKWAATLVRHHCPRPSFHSDPVVPSIRAAVPGGLT
jgi:hypothetical protein